MYYDNLYNDDLRFDGGESYGGGQGYGSGLKQFKGQYIRVRIRRMGWVIAQVIDYKHRTQLLELNVYSGGTPQYMMINVRDIGTLIPLGYSAPPEIYGSGTPSPGGYPGAPSPGGYPGAPSPGSYPGAPSPGGYPGAPSPGAYSRLDD
ncbi:hypothetical protein L1M59_30650 [Bacillus sp. ET1]|nr:hypothetical protein [Bacillus sp. ET1]